MMLVGSWVVQQLWMVATHSTSLIQQQQQQQQQMIVQRRVHPTK
jgi:hypothetical protein